MSCKLSPKAKQMARLSCLVVYVKIQFVHTTTRKIGSKRLQASTSSNILLERGFEKAFNECLGVSNVFPSVP